MRVARVNIRLCFPELSEVDQEGLVRECILHAGMWLCESGAVWNWSDEKILKHVTVRNPEMLELALRTHSGVILALPHLGNWEVVNSIISTQYEFACLYKHDGKDPLMSNYILRKRSGRGIIMAPADTSGIRVLYKHLKAGKIVGLLPDHQPTEAMGVFASFFGQPALTGTLISSLARKNQPAVLTLSVIRTEKGFEAIYDEVEYQDSHDPVKAAEGINQAIERCIELAPAQFQWVYSRFSKQPEGAGSPYRVGAVSKKYQH
jgi:KDO2-lipid IV(A) lauroyltransferase